MISISILSEFISQNPDVVEIKLTRASWEHLCSQAINWEELATDVDMLLRVFNVDITYKVDKG